MKHLKVLTEKEAIGLVTGTHKVGCLENISYNDLTDILGEPTWFEDGKNAEDKVCVEWVLRYGDSIYTIYDWKTYSLDYTQNELREWSIGGKDSARELLLKIQDLKS